MAFSANFLSPPLNIPTPTPAPCLGGPVACLNGPAWYARSAQTLLEPFETKRGRAKWFHATIRQRFKYFC